MAYKPSLACKSRVRKRPDGRRAQCIAKASVLWASKRNASPRRAPHVCLDRGILWMRKAASRISREGGWAAQLSKKFRTQEASHATM
eukprot:5699530-Pleurochrysis_carterae.AAC.1